MRGDVMNKYKISLLIFVFLLQLSLCSAEDDCFEHDPDYMRVNVLHGCFTYLYVPSVNVHEYNPPFYKIAGYFVYYDNRNRRVVDESAKTMIVRYDYKKKETYILKNNYWRKLDVSGTSDYHFENKSIANALFSVAYGMNFY